MSYDYIDSLILDCIDRGWKYRWTSPTVREIGMSVGINSTATVLSRLQRLTRDGHLECHEASPLRVLYRRSPRGSRGLSI